MSDLYAKDLGDNNKVNDMKNPEILELFQSDEDLAAFQDGWVKAWRRGGGATPYNKKVRGYFASIGVFLKNVQMYVAYLCSAPQAKLSQTQRQFVTFYESLHAEGEHELIETCSLSSQGQIFLLKSMYKYQDKTVLTVEHGNLEEVLDEAILARTNNENE